MGFAIIVKNTFLDVDESDGDGSCKRSSSIPRFWKPNSPHGFFVTQTTMSRASISTAASDSDLSERPEREDKEDTPRAVDQAPTASPQLNPSAAEFWMPPPPEAYMVFPMGDPMFPMIPLNAQAAMFQPLPEPLSEVSMILASTKAAILSNPLVKSAEVAEGPVGSTTTIEIEVSAEAKADEILSSAKASLLEAAACSHSTYILGYMMKPFTDIGDEGFKATISFTPLNQQVCWNLFQKSFCSCNKHFIEHWYHPKESDSVMLRVTLKRTEASQE